MKKTLLIFSTFVLVAASQADGADETNDTVRDGATLKSAIVLKNAYSYSSCVYQECIPKTNSQNMGQEIEYLEKRFGTLLKDWTPAGNNILHSGNKHYDEVRIEILSTGETKTVYFDITEPLTAYLEQLRNSSLPPAPRDTAKAAAQKTPPATDTASEPSQTPDTPEKIEPKKSSPDGKSFEQTIVILEAQDVIAEENIHLERTFGTWQENWRFQGDIVHNRDGKTYNEVTINRLPENTPEKRYFDITARYAFLQETFDSSD